MKVKNNGYSVSAGIKSINPFSGWSGLLVSGSLRDLGAQCQEASR